MLGFNMHTYGLDWKKINHPEGYITTKTWSSEGAAEDARRKKIYKKNSGSEATVEAGLNGKYHIWAPADELEERTKKKWGRSHGDDD